MELHIFKNKEQLCNALAVWISDLITTTLQEQENFTLVLSGGETPKLLFKELASPVIKEKISWERVNIFWGDERVVPFKDERNNANQAYDLLIDKIDIPASNVHVMRTDIEPLFAAKQYESLLHNYFDHTQKSFDLVLLGLGDDGHTLSLFPGTSVLDEENKNWVNAIYNEKQEMYRITLMPEIVNRASNVVFLVEGSKKAEIFKRVIEGNYDPLQLPAQIIKPVNGELHWFVDEDAAKDLNKTS
jgi:6-phosphogluconolactonase